MCRALVGLDDVDVVGVIPWTAPMQVHIASTVARPACPSCGTAARIKQTMRRRLVDLPSFGRPTVTVWRQIRWSCPSPTCSTGTWMHVDPRIVVGNRGMTDRAARWATEQVGRHGRSVSEVADDLGCDWHTVNRAVIAYGTALVDDPDRIGTVAVLGIDETAFVRVGRWRQRIWSTQLVGDEPTRRGGDVYDSADHRSHDTESGSVAKSDSTIVSSRSASPERVACERAALSVTTTSQYGIVDASASMSWMSFVVHL